MNNFPNATTSSPSPPGDSWARGTDAQFHPTYSRDGSVVQILHLFIVPILFAFATHSGFAFENFIKARGDQLVDGTKPFRFISFNIPNLLMIEDNVPFAETNPWRLPDKFELTDALATIHNLGGNVTRSYVITVKRTNDTDEMPRHVLGPGKFNEEAFRALDLALQTANAQDVRLIIPLVDNWIWQGGRAEYAGFRGKAKDDFWIDPQIIADFKETIRFILTRTNTLTGVRYADDKAILCWETGNEIDSPAAWTREIASYIKSLDRNHLVMDGFGASQLRAESLEIPEIDIVTTHHYPGQTKIFGPLIRENWQKAKGKKPYVVGEFGFIDTPDMEEAMRTVSETGTSGGLLWSLRFRNRDGGFYWHSEPFGGNQYKAFHWPASIIGKPYDEERLMTMVRVEAFKIRGEPVPKTIGPAAPKLLPITDAAAISWQGSVGATRYRVERAASPNGPWTVASENIDEAFTQYRPQFADEHVTRGNWFYRVIAKNDAGASKPSNIVGPVSVTTATLVDELADFRKIAKRIATPEIKDRDCRQAKEDAHRAAGKAGDALIYRLPSAISGFRVYAFFPREITPLKFSVSVDGKDFTEVAARTESYFQGAGDYDYWKPV
ncbi:MAG TPA: hypothetical protein VK327_03675, partial [Candidatus Paceibacterota bacterium]|nr:hypothetical protein [Candidatus Paceibacterota bacterium]